MPNPDGTRTRIEHRRNIVALTNTYIAEGLDADVALTKASAEYQRILKQEGEDKIRLVNRFLGIKD